MGNCCLRFRSGNKEKKPQPLDDIPGDFTINSQCKTIKEEKKNVNKVDELAIHSSLVVQGSDCDPYSVYDFIKVIGEGSYGKVSKVVHRKLNIVRAMKSIEKRSPNGIISEENTHELIREINILKSLDHPNIVKIYQYFNTKNKLYIASEFCSGGELFDQLTKVKNFQEKNIAYIMKQLLSAVNFLHLNGITHRDLKPENIMLELPREEGEETFEIKLIDFGTSQIYMNKSNTKIRKFDEIIGSSYYMAPEVLDGNYNEKCDCWSAGVIMYMLLSGTPPFNGSNDDEIFNSIKRCDLKYPIKYFKNVSKEAVDLLNNLLNRNVKQRFSAQKAIDHIWFKNSEIIEINNEKLESISDNLKKFNCGQKFQQACISYIVHNMVRNEEIEEYRKIFKKFDKNSDGRLSKEELIQGFSETMSEGEAREEIDRLINIIDYDNNNFIEFEEFLSAFMDKKKLLKEENLMETFILFDKDRSGKITIDELKVILTGNAVVSNDVWTRMISEIDQNKDGEISYSEFKKIMRKMIEA